MADITNVNLLFLRKARGVAALSRFAAQDDGTLLVSVPDEMEVRTFHIARFDAKGRSQVVETYSVETLRRTEIAASGSAYIGTTDDDLYVFRETRKTRFLSDRRAAYTDIALSEGGQRFATAFCDMLGSGHTIALGDGSGRLMWTKDIVFPVSRVAVDREARHVAVIGESGDLLVLDTARATVLEHHQDASLTAVATAGPERTVFTGGGGVGAVGSDGKLHWFTEVVGEPIDVALDAEGRTVAVLVRLDNSSGRLVFLSMDGLPTWDIDFEDARPTGLSLSASGRYAAVSLRDGSISLYELQYGERMASVNAEQVLAEARAAREHGNFHAAVDLLRARLAAVPSDTQSCQALSDTLAALRERSFTAAATSEAVGDWREADARLDELLTASPLDSEAAGRRHSLRQRWAETVRAQGRAALAGGNGPEAEAHFLEAIFADPLDLSAREALAEARYAAASAALAAGRQRLTLGQYAEAIAALTEAQTHGASGPEVSGLLREARVAEALAIGNALYQDRQYAAALFQFKKVLRLEPDHAEAVQKLGYAQNFLQNTQLNDRFTRLE